MVNLLDIISDDHRVTISHSEKYGFCLQVHNQEGFKDNEYGDLIIENVLSDEDVAYFIACALPHLLKKHVPCSRLPWHLGSLKGLKEVL